MPTFADRLLAYIQAHPGLSDRELATALLGADKHPSPVNQDARLLAGRGRIKRVRRAGDVYRNYPPGHEEVPAGTAREAAAITPTPAGLSEDEIKFRLQQWLRDSGWEPEIAWGKARGIDVDARRGAERWVIEVKGLGSLNAMRVNYFLAILGETLQRMDERKARYSIALPDIPQYRGLWERLPALAKQRTKVTALFVSPDGAISEQN